MGLTMSDCLMIRSVMRVQCAIRRNRSHDLLCPFAKRGGDSIIGHTFIEFMSSPFTVPFHSYIAPFLVELII